MVNLPWRGDGSDGGDSAAGKGGATAAEDHPDAIVVCEFQDGTLAVYPDRVEIHRVGRSQFDDRTIPADEIVGVDFSKGLTIGYLQIEQVDVPAEAGGLLSDPVNQNTLHFSRADRDCATEAREAILSNARG